MSYLRMMKLTILLQIIMIICHLTNGKVYKVGGSSGWTNVGHLGYKSWAASKTFHVGDTIVFNYNKQFHNVVRVTHKNYNSCNATSSPYTTWASGNDSFTIRNPGHFYFICGVPGHCQDGQKVDIRVPKPHTPGPAPSPMPSGSSPSSPIHVGPSKPGPVSPSPPALGPSKPGPVPPTPPTLGPSQADLPPSHHHHSGSSATYPSWIASALLVFCIIGIAY